MGKKNQLFANYSVLGAWETRGCEGGSACFLLEHWSNMSSVFFQRKLEWKRDSVCQLTPLLNTIACWVGSWKILKCSTCSTETHMWSLVNRRKGSCCVWWVLDWTLDSKCPYVIKLASFFPLVHEWKGFEPLLNQIVSFAMACHCLRKKYYLIFYVRKSSDMNTKPNFFFFGIWKATCKFCNDGWCFNTWNCKFLTQASLEQENFLSASTALWHVIVSIK